LLVTGCASGGAGRGVLLEETVFSPSLGVDLQRMTPTSSGLYFQDLRVGQGESARSGLKVAVRYDGWLPDGRLFDSSQVAGEPISFTLGRREVIRGWEEGVEGMRVGGLRKLVIPSSLGYGRRGLGGVIPPDATLVFLIELVQVGGEA